MSRLTTMVAVPTGEGMRMFRVVASVLLMFMSACSADALTDQLASDLPVKPSEARDEAQAMLASDGSPTELNVLFVGNSYTYYNEMPEMVTQIASFNGGDIETTIIAGGGLFLADHAGGTQVADALASGRYDVVVLQEQSMAPAIAYELSQRTLPAAMELDRLADAAGTRVIWFQTWGRQFGLPEHGFSSFEQMQASLSAGYQQIAQSTNAEVAEVGESFERIIRSGANLALYEADGSHPTAIGSYVAAIEITETILGRTVSLAPRVDGVDAEAVRAVVAFG